MSFEASLQPKTKLWARALFLAHLIMALSAYLESVFPDQNPLNRMWIQLPLHEQIAAIALLDIWFVALGFGILRFFSWDGGLPALLSIITEFRGRRGMYAFLLMVLIPALVLFRIFTIQPNAVANWMIINGFLLSALGIAVIGGGDGPHLLRPILRMVGAPLRVFAVFRQGTKRPPHKGP